MVLLRDRIYQMIRDAILDCEYQPDEELREQTLAARYHVSRSPIRDSLLRLERDDLVTVLPRRGYRVRPISIPDIESLFELRLLVEPACAAAAASADDAKLAMLDQFRNFTKYIQAKVEFLDYNQSFHCTVADLSGNRRLAAIALDVAEQSRRMIRVNLGGVTDEHIRDATREHEAIIDAIQAQDSDTAAGLSHHHVEIARMRVVARVANPR